VPLVATGNSPKHTVKILIVDQHILFREGLQSLLSREPDMEVVGQTGTVQGAVEQAVRLKPDVVLIDTCLRDGSGLEALRQIKAQQPETRVVILSEQDSNENLLEAFRTGTNGYILKDTPIESLVAALRALGRGEPILSRLLTRRIVEEYARLGYESSGGDVSLDNLTARELEVLRHVGSGASNREIAARLSISEHTVKAHVRNVFEKLRLEKRSQMVNVSRRYIVVPATR
jgi:DNA-binding NarL/FixJ family response regulator